jgi:hypothetical protein
LDVPGPYLEYPLLEKDGHIYNGGPPGPDRVVMNTAGDYAGEITHTGATGNRFVAKIPERSTSQLVEW